MKRIFSIGIVALCLAAASAAERPPRPAPTKGPPGRTGKPPAKDESTQIGGERLEVSELMKIYEARQFVSGYGKLPYRLLRPLDYQHSRQYPLMVCLHGVPGRGKDNSLQLGATYPANVLARDEMRKQYPCFVIVPQSTAWWGDEPYGAKGSSGRKGKYPQSMTMLLESVDALQDAFNIDPNRIYVTGHSMGGFGAFNALATDPNTWGGAVIVGGGGDPNTASRFAHVPLWVHCGQKSSILHYSEKMVEALRSSGGKPSFTVVPNTDHRCWSQVYESRSVWAWLFSQRRTLPLPPVATQPALPPTTLPALIPGLLDGETAEDRRRLLESLEKKGQ